MVISVKKLHKKWRKSIAALLALSTFLSLPLGVTSCGAEPSGDESSLSPQDSESEPVLEKNDYEVAAENGYAGTEEEWLTLLEESGQYLEYELLEDNTYGVRMKQSQTENQAIDRIAIPSVHDGLPVSTILNRGFRNNPAKEIILPDSIRVIGYYAFLGSRRLERVSMAEGILEISHCAFSTCLALEEIILPDSVISIGDDVFDMCDKLALNTYGNAGYVGTSENPYLYLHTAADQRIESAEIHEDARYIGSKAFQSCSKLTDIVIPDNIVSIGSGAFDCCSGLTSIVIPDSVESVSSYVFNGCSSLESVTLPADLTELYAQLFRNCKKLSTVEIPDGVTLIASRAFEGCSGLTALTIPKSVTQLDRAVFIECEKLTALGYEGTTAEWNRIEKDKMWAYGASLTVVHCADGDVVIDAAEREK